MKFQVCVKMVIKLLAVVAVISIGIGTCSEKKADTLNILAADVTFETGADAEARFAVLQQAGGPNLSQVFKRDRINVLIPHNNWAGRLSSGGVSQQAFFSVDTMRAIFEVKDNRRRRFRFSIYNPAGSKLSYLIYIEQQKNKKMVFKKYFAKRQSFTATVTLGKSLKKFKLVLETRGKGIGAWVNPQLVRKKEHPRIFIVIVLDSLRSDHTSLYGYHRKTTPVLEQLASDSRVFRQAFSSSSWTLPAHVSLFSGKDLPEHRVLTYTDHIREDYPLLAEVFQKNGFFTAAFTGGGFVADGFGFHRGFQVYSNNPGNVSFYDSAVKVLESFKNYAEAFWGEDLFIFLHTYQVHAPYNFPESLKKHFNRNLQGNSLGAANFLQNWKVEYFRSIAENSKQQLVDTYDTAIYYADQILLGGVVQYLKAKGVYEQAGLVITSDHGEEFYDHGSWEHGHSLYNELVKIPLLIKYPGNRHKGNNDTLTSIADIPALLLEKRGMRFAETFFLNRYGAVNRVLPVSLPYPPMIRQIPAKISFIDERYHFIYNIIDRKALEYFDPQPRNPEVFELYERQDEKETKNLADGNAKAMKKFLVLLEKYLRRLRKVPGQKHRVDEALQKELKSLGYLAD